MDAKWILWNLAKQCPDFERVAMEALPALDSGIKLPNEFSEMALDAIKSVPDAESVVQNLETAMRLKEQSVMTPSYGVTDLASPELIVAIIVLLGAYCKIEYRNGKWSLQAGYKALNAKKWEPVFSVLAIILGKLGEGLTEASETLTSQK